jgi:hypothetical protein
MRQDLRKPPRASRPLLFALGAGSGIASLALLAAVLARLIMVIDTPLTLGIFAIVLGAATYPLCARGVGPKRLVLFLRRFGNEELNEAVLSAFRQALGRRYRIVTLDDSSFVPVGLPARIMLTSIASAIGLGFLLGAGSMIALLPFVIDSLDPDHIRVETEIAIFACWLFSTAMAVIGALLYAIVFLYQRIERLSKVSTPRDIRFVVRAVRKAKRVRRAPSFAAPLARVVRTTDALWRDAVIALAGLADVVIIDISIPRESIVWELQQMVCLRVPYLVLRCEEVSPASGKSLAWQKKIDSITQGRPLLRYGAPDTLTWQALLPAMDQLRRLPPDGGEGLLTTGSVAGS